VADWTLFDDPLESLADACDASTTGSAGSEEGVRCFSPRILLLMSASSDGGNVEVGYNLLVSIKLRRFFVLLREVPPDLDFPEFQLFPDQENVYNEKDLRAFSRKSTFSEAGKL
jgi:hypothetical protein